MADVWDSDTYYDGSSNAGAGNGRIAVALKKDTDPVEVWWRRDDGSRAWTTPPVLVGTVDGETSTSFRTHFDGISVWVENGIDTIWQSRAYGSEGSWVAD